MMAEDITDDTHQQAAPHRPAPPTTPTDTHTTPAAFLMMAEDTHRRHPPTGSTTPTSTTPTTPTDTHTTPAAFLVMAEDTTDDTHQQAAPHRPAPTTTPTDTHTTPAAFLMMAEDTTDDTHTTPARCSSG